MTKVYLTFYTDKGRVRDHAGKPEKERPKQDTTYYAKAFCLWEEATDASNANSTLNGVIYKMRHRWRQMRMGKPMQENMT